MTDYLEFVCNACGKRQRAKLSKGGIPVATVIAFVVPSVNKTTTTIPLTYMCHEKSVDQVYNYTVPNDKVKEYKDVEITSIEVVG
jgi:hypothetical protein